MMDSSVGYPESSMEHDDAPIPCKGCGEILEEGKAFELAGNRWHIDCFRCNKCSTLLDSDANLLLLGDGSLICNNCTYSCSACGNKIEDLAILTGDQAFCAACFRCRNCKKKIENLKYARTSQGIFCMECHESLMQRRRKKSAKNGAHRRDKHNHNHHQGNNMLLDKSLPSLPPSAIDRSAFTPDTDSLASDGYSDTPTELPRISQKKTPTPKPSSHSGTPTEPPRVSQKRPPHSRSSSSKSTKRERSPATVDDDSKENLMLPSTTYKSNRHSTISQRSDLSANGEEFFIALDPNPVLAPSPLTRYPKFNSHEEKVVKPQAPESRIMARDHFNTNHANGQSPMSRVASQDYESTRASSGPNSPRESRHSSQPSSPHIAYQEIGREPSDTMDNVRKRIEHSITHGSMNSIAHDKPRDLPSELRSRPNVDSRDGKFMLQEAPKSKKSGSTRTSKSDGLSPSLDTSLSSRSSSAPASAISELKEEPMVMPNGESPSFLRPNKSNASPLVTQDLKNHELRSAGSPTSQSSLASTQLHTLPQRSDSLAKSAASKHQIARREVGGAHAAHVGKLSSNIPSSNEGGAHIGKLPNIASSNEAENDKPAIASPSLAPGYNQPPVENSNGSNVITIPVDPSSTGTMVESPHPSRAHDRLPLADSSDDSFTSPRNPPLPPVGSHKSNNASVSTQMSESTRNGDIKVSPSLPRYSAGGEFSMDEDLARILGNVDHPEHASFLRRVSNSVRHARSHSERGTRLSREHKWPKSPLTAAPGGGFGPEISSPVSSSPELKDELMWLKNELRRERQKTAEKDLRLQELEAELEAKSSIKKMNTELQEELREKRSTMVVLDTQKEIVVRELELLTDHIAAAKRSGEPLNLGGLSNVILREFAQSLQKLKQSFTPQIEDLTQTRNELIEKVAELTKQKDRTTQEFEQLSARNAQLAELNNQLVQQIQELYNVNTASSLDAVRPSPSPNGLGIYTHQSQERSNRSIETRDLHIQPSLTESTLTGSTAVHELDDNSTAYPQVVNMHKAQPRKFWKMKNVTRGLRGTFTSNDPNKAHRDGQFPESQPYGSGHLAQDYPNNSQQRTQMQDPLRQGFGLFGNPKQKPALKNVINGAISAVNPDGSPALFGSDLEHRAEYERGNIPAIVMRCIQEVELRGMDSEGIYRKSGGNTQTQQIKEGFERTNDYDISDPDLDINAVTSTLKQYFHKLPSPLITYEVYDKLLESATIIENDPKHCVALMRAAINDLPSRHRACLEFLVFHLARVVSRETENLMTSLNVAVVFAPTIMRPESLVREMSDTQAKNLAVQFLIENCDKVFLEGGQ